MNFLEDSAITEDTADINITPLIDIVFLLLIFFMVTTTFAESHGISVDLPSASEKNSAQKKTDFMVTIDREGKIFLDTTAVATSDILVTLTKFKKEHPSSALVLRADKDTRHQQVVTVMDAAKRAGITNLGIATSSSLLNAQGDTSESK